MKKPQLVLVLLLSEVGSLRVSIELEVIHISIKTDILC